MQTTPKNPLTPFLLLAMVWLLAACAIPSPDTPPTSRLPDALPLVPAFPLSQGEKLSVVATTGLIADVVANIAAQDIDLTILISPGQDPHTFEPAPRAVAAIESADIIFINGFGFEQVLLETIQNVAQGVVVPVSAGIQPLQSSGTDHHDVDPHVWVIPANGIAWAENIAAVLSAADPAHSTAYQQRAAAYIDQLNVIDNYIRSQVALIPPASRKLITDHEMLTYFAAEYDFELIGALIPAASTSASASPGDLAALVELIQQENVPAIFISASAGQGIQRLADSLTRETGVSLSVVPLLTGALASPGQPGDTYLGYLRYNIDQIVSALSG